LIARLLALVRNEHELMQRDRTRKLDDVYPRSLKVWKQEREV